MDAKSNDKREKQGQAGQFTQNWPVIVYMTIHRFGHVSVRFIHSSLHQGQADKRVPLLAVLRTEWKDVMIVLIFYFSAPQTWNFKKRLKEKKMPRRQIFRDVRVFNAARSG